MTRSRAFRAYLAGHPRQSFYVDAPQSEILLRIHDKSVESAHGSSALAATVEGAGAIDAAVKRLIAFEMQLGTFAVAQLRIYAELVHLIRKAPKTTQRMFVTDTLGRRTRPPRPTVEPL